MPEPSECGLGDAEVLGGLSCAETGCRWLHGDSQAPRPTGGTGSESR
jgi:hypothetical protein